MRRMGHLFNAYYALNILAVTPRLVNVRHQQGRLIGRMKGLGFQLRTKAILNTLTEDVLKSSEIEGEKLDRDQVCSSISAA
jgi:Fic family protein